VGNRILPLPERSRNQTPRGIGQLPEQTLRNTNHIADDKSSDYSCAACRKNLNHAPPAFGLIWTTTIAKTLRIGHASVYLVWPRADLSDQRDHVRSDG
jgi:hypothetical protein